MKFETKFENQKYPNSFDQQLKKDCKHLLNSLNENNKLLLECLNKKSADTSNYRSQQKTVTFSDYLRITNDDIPLRRTRSFSSDPRIFPENKFRSILKKGSNGSINSDLNDEYLNGSNSSISSGEESKSTVRSLSNIYGELNIEDDFDEKIKYIIKYTDLNNDSKFLNKKSLIDYISKKRQKYLSQDYDDNVKINIIENSTQIKQAPNHSAKLNPNKNVSICPKRSKSADSIYSTKKKDKSINKKDLENSNAIEDKRPKSNKNKKDRNYKKNLKNATKNKPLLGLDWAIDNLNSKKEKNNFEKSEDYWQELSRFRSDNKQECISSKLNNFNGTINSILENDASFYKNQMMSSNDDLIEGVNHKCIHSYTLNDRLFPVPVYKDKNGQSLCPVCKSTQKDSNSVIPQYFKISIPKSKVINSISIEPKKGAIKNLEDTLSLADNCFAGHRNYTSSAKPNNNKFVDLKSSTKSKEKFQKLTLEELKQIQSNRDPSTATLYSKANAMRFDLEDFHQKRLRELMPKF